MTDPIFPSGQGESLTFIGIDLTQSETELRALVQRWNLALEQFGPASSPDPDLRHLLSWIRLRCAVVHAVLKEWDAATTHLQSVIDEQAGPNEVGSAQILLGAIYAERGQDEQAIACWTETLRQSETTMSKPGLALLYLHRGMLYGRQRRYQDAIADCDRVVREVPDCAEAYSVRGISYAYLGDLDRGLAECLRAVELGLQARCFHRLGEVHLMRKEYQQALVAFRRAVERDPTNAAMQASLRRAQAYLLLGLSIPDASKSAPPATPDNEVLQGTDETTSEE